MPGFIQVLFKYYFSNYIHRSIVYGMEPRNRLDLYMPPNCDDDSPKPMVIFVTGGAWIIGLVASLCCWDSFLSSHFHAISLGVEITLKGLKLMPRLINRYKGWGALLGQQLAEHHIIVTCLDYRNFPQGSVSDMVADISTGIGYVCQNITNLGGDPKRVFLAGHSAGAHLAACALVKQAQKEVFEDATKLSWRSHELKAFFAISGG
jgi:prenylcysteine alpha-carboxyl methylesterase